MSRKVYPLRVARAAFGIRAQDLRTLTRGSWWARRWIAAMERMRMGPRLGRGRQYAVSGQVTDLVMEGSRVEATVVGSRPEPYRVSFTFTSVEGDARERLADALRAEPMLLARLLTDDLPLEVPELFRVADVPFFPRAEPLGQTPEGRPRWDVQMRCSCPDWARPCKHMAAVLFLLGEIVTRRPSVLLSLRGLDIGDLLPPEDCAIGTIVPPGVPDEAPSACIDSSKGAQSSRLRETSDPAPFVRRLGAVPFWRGTARCVEALAKMQTRVQPIARDAAEGRSIDLRDDR